MDSFVLVCDDCFDNGGTGWMKSRRLREYIDTAPPVETVRFVGKVLNHIDNEQSSVRFTFDNTSMDIRVE